MPPDSRSLTMLSWEMDRSMMRLCGREVDINGLDCMLGSVRQDMSDVETFCKFQRELPELSRLAGNVREVLLREIHTPSTSMPLSMALIPKGTSTPSLTTRGLFCIIGVFDFLDKLRMILFSLLSSTFGGFLTYCLIRQWS